MEHKMKVEVLVSDSRYEKALTELMGREKLLCNYSSTIEGFLEESMNSFPRIFIIQDSGNSPLRILDLVRDIRELFGAVVTIVLIGEDIPGHRIAALIGVGADNIFNYPFDAGLIEDFLFKSSKKELCRPFKYRHVPSGEAPISIKVMVFVTEINVDGVMFESRDLIINGVVLTLDLSSLIEIPEAKLRVRITSSEKTTSGAFASIAEFVDLDENLRKKIAFKLKIEA